MNDTEMNDTGSDSGTEAEPAKVRTSRTVSAPVSTLVASGVAVLALVAAVVLGALLVGARGELSERDGATAAADKAKQVSTDYAVGAATIDYNDVKSWIATLKSGTGATLSNKFDASAPKLEEILTSLQWTSSATPIAASVSSVEGPVYKVDVFLNVTSKNVQNTEGAQTTVTYNVTLDSSADWLITDVGGVGSGLPN